jgi:DNA-binding transcriptional ArsR family regulator
MVYHREMSSATVMENQSDDHSLNRVFGALSDPTRRAIIARLTRGEATMSEIAGQFEMSLPGVSKHVSVLEEAGIVHRWRTGRTRRCRLEPERIQSANAWLDQQTKYWTDSLEALARFVEDDQESS